MRLLKLLLPVWFGFFFISLALDLEPNTLKTNTLWLGLFLMIWGIATYLDGDKK